MCHPVPTVSSCQKLITPSFRDAVVGTKHVDGQNNIQTTRLFNGCGSESRVPRGRTVSVCL